MPVDVPAGYSPVLSVISIYYRMVTVNSVGSDSLPAAFHDHGMNMVALATVFKYTFRFIDTVVCQIRFKQFQYG